LPSMTDLGRGSPVGTVFYQHNRFPERYHDAFFQGDWSRGRIVVGLLEIDGATYRETMETFLLGEPLNITDVDVGPDGALYFSKGGRRTEGGLFRVVYTGADRRPEPADLLTAVLSQPQPRSAWGRARIKELRQRMGRRWSSQLRQAVEDHQRAVHQRLQALELLHVYGPPPAVNLLIGLRAEQDWELRAASTLYLGMYSTK